MLDFYADFKNKTKNIIYRFKKKLTKINMQINVKITLIPYIIRINVHRFLNFSANLTYGFQNFSANVIFTNFSCNLEIAEKQNAQVSSSIVKRNIYNIVSDKKK